MCSTSGRDLKRNFPDGFTAWHYIITTPNPIVEDHPLSDVHYYLFSIFAATVYPYLEDISSVCYLRAY
jgi:hypothetical protein